MLQTRTRMDFKAVFILLIPVLAIGYLFVIACSGSGSDIKIGHSDDMIKITLGAPTVHSMEWGSDETLIFEHGGSIYEIDPSIDKIDRLAQGHNPIISTDVTEVFFFSDPIPGDAYPWEPREVEALAINRTDGEMRTMGKATLTGEIEGSLLSPNGKWAAIIVFESVVLHDDNMGASMRSQLAIWNLESGEIEATQLLDISSDGMQWSPDGAKLAVAGRREGGPDFIDIWVLDMANDTVDNVSFDPSPHAYHGNNNPVWSPDGLMIAYNSHYMLTDEQKAETNGVLSLSQTWITTVYGGTKSLLSEVSMGNVIRSGVYDWSPDSTMLALISPAENGYESDIWVMDIRGENRRLLHSTPANATAIKEIRWSPDGASIALVRHLHTGTSDPETDINLVDVDLGPS